MKNTLNAKVIESLNYGVTWSTRRSLHIKKFHLVLCFAINKVNHEYSSKIIIPSEIERGRAFMVDVFNKERLDDKEIVVGDTFNLVYSFNSIIFSDKNFSFNSKPSGCDLDKLNLQAVSNEGKFYTKYIRIPFVQVTSVCNHNYSLELKIKNEKYFIDPQTDSKPTNPVIYYNLNVLNFIVPYFLNSEKLNHTIVLSEPVQGGNRTEVVIAYSDLKVQSDKTIELNCQATGRPKPLVHWFKDGHHFNVSEEKYKYDVTGSLKILRTHPVDSGKYECEVINRYGRVKRSFNVDVESPIKAFKELSRKQVILIVMITVATFILLVLLLFALSFIVHQKRENSLLRVSIQAFLIRKNFEIAEISGEILRSRFI